MNYPLLLCISSILLAGSGGLNFGLAPSVEQEGGWMIAALSGFFIIAGFFGIMLAFQSLFKKEEGLADIS
ncbi:MAG: hypothetical protein WC120_04140 [Parcubacteria group bacterium]